MNKRIIYIFCLLLFNYSLQGSAGSGALSSTSQIKGVSDRYVEALKEGLPLPDLDHELSSLNENAQDLAIKEIRHVIETEDLKTAVLPNWLANDYENYTDTFAKEVIMRDRINYLTPIKNITAMQHYSAMADHIAKKMGGYRFGPKNIDKHVPALSQVKEKFDKAQAIGQTNYKSFIETIRLCFSNEIEPYDAYEARCKDDYGEYEDDKIEFENAFDEFGEASNQDEQARSMMKHRKRQLVQMYDLLQDFILLKPDNAEGVIPEINLDLEIAKCENLPSITHVSVHVSDIEALRDKLTGLFRNKPELILIVNFDNAEQTNNFKVPGQIQNLIVAGRDITTIGYYFLHCCRDLISLQLPAGITTIEDGFLECCTSLTHFELPASLETVGSWFLCCCGSLTNLQLPTRLTKVGNGFLNSCISLTSLQLPEGVKTIGDWSLENCISLTNLQLPESLTTIGDWSLQGCTSLTCLQLPAGITTVEYYFLKNCTSLTRLELPADLIAAGYGFLKNCTNLKHLTLGEELYVTEINYLHDKRRFPRIESITIVTGSILRKLDYVLSTFFA